MSDFLIDLRDETARTTEFAAGYFRHYPDIRVETTDNDAFSIVISRSDDWKLWGPSVQNSAIDVWLAGRVALDPDSWAEAQHSGYSGGLACRAIARAYLARGAGALPTFNGNFTIILHDKRSKKLYLVTDPCGAAPVFQSVSEDAPDLFCSHPDVLARSSGNSDLDLTSLGEFLASGKVSYPYTYYTGINAIPYGTVLEVDLVAKEAHSRSYFEPKFAPRDSDTIDNLAEELAEGFRASVRRRTRSELGQTVVSLSGGLDSRMILCATDSSAELKAVSFYDQENTEIAIAKKIAAAQEVPHILLKRKFEHYGDSAEAAVRISGGMSSIASNHYLGFRDQILETGVANLLTGCYCDYFFKALAVTRRVHPVWRTESYAPFSHNWYRPLFSLSDQIGRQVRSRLAEVFPEEIRNHQSEEAVFQTEIRRLFPISYEPDSMQRVVPHRVLPWYLPIVDRQIIDVYLRTPPRLKLNASMFSKMVAIVCGAKVSAIADANTNAPVDSSRARQLFGIYSKAFANRFVKHAKPGIATTGSWPNWNYYLKNSATIRRLWEREQTTSRDLLTELLGQDPFSKSVEEWADTSSELFVRVLTLKLWFELQNSPNSEFPTESRFQRAALPIGSTAD